MEGYGGDWAALGSSYNELRGPWQVRALLHISRDGHNAHSLRMRIKGRDACESGFFLTPPLG